jgi:hypothetical protein
MCIGLFSENNNIIFLIKKIFFSAAKKLAIKFFAIIMQTNQIHASQLKTLA